jgi:polar amino acid transport system permease protein
MVAVLWYLLITSILNVVQSAIERHYARGDRDATARTRGAVDAGAVNAGSESR